MASKVGNNLFRLKDPCINPACKIYKRMCSCVEFNTGDTIYNVETRWVEHNIPPDKSNSSKQQKAT